MNTIAFVVLVILVIFLYFLPAVIAYKRNHVYKHIILVLNIFGFTGITWVVAMIWAIFPSEKSLIDPLIGNVTGTGNRNAGDTIGAAKYGAERGYQMESRKDNLNRLIDMEEKDCSFCGEKIKAIAIKCKHCSSILT